MVYLISRESWNTPQFFISSVKRVGQALETRLLVDEIFSRVENNALIVISGDFSISPL
jgi:hypothetical protein